MLLSWVEVPSIITPTMDGSAQHHYPYHGWKCPTSLHLPWVEVTNIITPYGVADGL